MSTTRCCALLSLLALPIACAESSSPTSPLLAVVTDTLGNKFDVYCNSGLCGLTPHASSLEPKACSGANGTDFFLLVPSWLLSIYAVNPPMLGMPTVGPYLPSHPVACSSDADCVPSGVPSGQGTLTYACSYGLCLCTSAACETEDDLPYTDNVITLCQANIPWPASCPYITSPDFASRLADVAVTCGSQETCAKVPASCRQWTGPTSPPIDSGIIPDIDAGL